MAKQRDPQSDTPSGTQSDLQEPLSDIQITKEMSVIHGSNQGLTGPLSSVKYQTAANSKVSFLTLPAELRCEVYSLILLRERPIDPWLTLFPGDTKLELGLGLLRVSKVVNSEACSLFYKRNCFDFSSESPENISSFLAHIGVHNASSIRHIITQFPMFQIGNDGKAELEDDGKVKLRQDSMNTLAIIQASCTSLSTLTISALSLEEQLFRLGDHKLATETLQLVDTRIRGISSLREIIAMVFEESMVSNSKPGHRDTIESLGWTIKHMNWEEYFGSESEDEDEYDGSHGFDHRYDNLDNYDFDLDPQQLLPGSEFRGSRYR
ncbi:hypothetical protein GGR57DRAFT_306651 [Xylariaceae sp. FL1272]|nr:hypothetical protein GGR57DRAFT_306651 [Xylariaceae sp. FL1272]